MAKIENIINLDLLAIYDTKIKEHIRNNASGNGVEIYDNYSQFPTITKNTIVFASNDYLNNPKGLYYGDLTSNTYSLISNSNNGSGIEIYNDYSQFPNTLQKDSIIFAKEDVVINGVTLLKGLYCYNATNSLYFRIEDRWGQLQDKPFDDIDNTYFEVNTNGLLVLSKTWLDVMNNRFNLIETVLQNVPLIDDTSTTSATSTWSVFKIVEELNKKATIADNHSHNNKDELAKFSENTITNELTYDSKTIMFKDEYDVDNDGIVDKAKEADKLTGVTATTSEMNYLIGLTGNIQNQLNAVTNGVSFQGEFTSYADMISFFGSSNAPKQGYWVYIQTDETKGNQTNVQYVYNGTQWVYGGGRTSVNDASDTTKGIIQLSGDLTGTSSSPTLIKVINATTIGHIGSISIDENGRVIAITEDTTLAQRLADLESRPRTYVSQTRPTNLKNGDFWIEG